MTDKLEAGRALREAIRACITPQRTVEQADALQKALAAYDAAPEHVCGAEAASLRARLERVEGAARVVLSQLNEVGSAANGDCERLEAAISGGEVSDER